VLLDTDGGVTPVKAAEGAPEEGSDATIAVEEVCALLAERADSPGAPEAALTALEMEATDVPVRALTCAAEDGTVGAAADTLADRPGAPTPLADETGPPAAAEAAGCTGGRAPAWGAPPAAADTVGRAVCTCEDPLRWRAPVRAAPVCGPGRGSGALASAPAVPPASEGAV